MTLRFPDNEVFKFVQSNSVGAALTSSNVANEEYLRYFSSADVPQFSSFALVFDQYRIMGVEVVLFPRNPTTVTGSTVNRGLLYSVVDYDDAAALSTTQNYIAYTNCQISPATFWHRRRFRPHIATAAYSGSFASYANMSSDTWLDCASTGVQYYGVKFLVSQSDVAGDEVVFDLFERILVEFRNVR
jgi:hypothetical protein